MPEFGVVTIILSLFLTCAYCHEKVSYDGYVLLSVQVDTASDVQWLQRLADEYSQERKLDIWSYPTKSHSFMHVLVSPGFHTRFSRMLQKRGLHNRVVEIIRSTSASSTRRRRRSRSTRHSVPFPLDDYHTFQEIETWLQKLNSTRPHRFHLSSLGTTAEGRNVWLVKISNGTKNTKKPIIFIDAGMHAREWISHATALYIIKALLQHQRNGDSDIWNGIDWYIVPVVNPDGYVYSMTTDRLWRKSRSQSGGNDQCKGVDINRNFDFHFGEAGSNTYFPCSNVYAGPHAFSEVETDMLARKLRQLRPALKAYVSLHSYGQLWLVPWGYSKEKPDNYQRQSDMARKAIEALKRVNQTNYSFGTIADLMYPASGTSVDYAHSLGIPFSLALELRPEDSVLTHGFLYPPEYIMPTGKETWEALKTIAKVITTT